jgi:leader peptidase (prepilin peptidase)/N-methyltransferase
MWFDLLTATINTSATPGWFWSVTVFFLGAIIGSFLNVYIYRFHTGKSLAGSSHCLSCGTRLRWFELFPLLSYLLIQGRCRHCHARVPVRYFLVELLTGLLFLLTLTVTLRIIEILLLWVVLAVLVVILTYDYYHFIIPDALTLTLTVLVVPLVAYPLLLGQPAWQPLLGDALAAVAGSAFFLFLWLISKGAWLGFGDVKLAFPLGVLVGAGQVFSFVVLSFWIGAGVSLVILGMQRWRRGKSHLRLLTPAITMKTAVPFAPFLIAGALVTFFTDFNVLSLFYFTL